MLRLHGDVLRCTPCCLEDRANVQRIIFNGIERDRGRLNVGVRGSVVSRLESRRVKERIYISTYLDGHTFGGLG